MNKTYSIFEKLENVLRYVYKNGLHPFLWFEENQDTAYKYAMRIALAIWLSLFGLVIFLLCTNIFRPNILSLSSVGISLSAMIASLMMWYNIETTTRNRKQEEEKAIQKEFHHFSELSFRTYRAAEEAHQECFKVIPEDIAMMLVSMIEQYLKEYPKFSLIYFKLDNDEKRWLREQTFGLHFDLINIKRSLENQDRSKIREYADGAYSDLRMIMINVLKTPTERLDQATNQRVK